MRPISRGITNVLQMPDSGDNAWNGAEIFRLFESENVAMLYTAEFMRD